VTEAQGNAGPVLKAYIERVERLEVEIKALNEDKRDLYAEAKGNGFDVKAMKTIIGIRRKDPNEVAEHDTIVETYMQALGML
jgi:uncharacterized protein (UPF0335 family)